MRFPWKGTGISCAVVTLLVILRCLTTIGRHLYYGGTNWSPLVLGDPWFYVGMACAALGIACFTILIILENKNSRR